MLSLIGEWEMSLVHCPFPPGDPICIEGKQFTVRPYSDHTLEVIKGGIHTAAANWNVREKTLQFWTLIPM